jgi:uncharacterized protein (TIGR03435 family)
VKFFRVDPIVAIIGMLSASAPAAQAPASPSFEVASVKPARPEARLQKPMGCGFPARGRFGAFGDLRWLIACAYDIPPGRRQQEILGGPRWVDDDLFQIEARATSDDAPTFTLTQGYSMLRTLLSDRFKLAVHRETKELPMYALVMARRDGKPGPHLRLTTPDCAAWLASGRRGPPPRVLGDVPCGLQRVSASALRGGAMTMTRLADMLSPRVERPVQDRTGLTGNFDLEVQWTPEPRTIAPTDAQPRSILPPVDPNGPSLFSALEEQLGLKLQPTRGSIDVLVIDSVDYPTAD